MDQQMQSLYIEMPRVSMPVFGTLTPQGDINFIHLRGKTRFEIQAYKQSSNDVVVIDDSRSINGIAYGIKKARPSYSSLMNYGMNQRLLEKNKVTEEAMRKAFKNLDDDIWVRYSIWAEFMDSTPEKRGHKLPRGTDVAIYRGIKVSGENIDASCAKPVFLNLPKETGKITNEWKIALGASEDTFHYPADLDYSKKHSDGLNALVWGFRGRERPFLYSVREPRYWYSDRGALLGRLNATSKYQLELEALGKDLEASKKLYADLGSKIISIEGRINNLKKMEIK